MVRAEAVTAAFWLAVVLAEVVGTVAFHKLYGERLNTWARGLGERAGKWLIGRDGTVP